jgi:hypothetical protein
VADPPRGVRHPAVRNDRRDRETLRCGEDKLEVNAVFIGGEHGQYDQIYAFGGKKYPRYEFFKQVTSVFKEEGRAVPVFSHKHLSWKWDWASEMVTESKRLGFPFMAGSSLPAAWRMPPVDVPHGARVEEAMVVAGARW